MLRSVVLIVAVGTGLGLQGYPTFARQTCARQSNAYTRLSATTTVSTEESMEASVDEIMGLLESKEFPESIVETVEGFFETYLQVLKDTGRNPESALPVLVEYLSMVEEQLEKPFKFEPYHKAVYTPQDYYDMDTRFMEPLIDMEDSVVLGHEYLSEIKKQLAAGENVVFLSNHQTEADPSAWSALMDRGNELWRDEQFAKNLIMVAGDRVTTDPLAVPFSKARNLLCIFSKRHIANPPERKREKQLHNTRTMGAMLKLLGQGGACIWVAPSGGRDRPNYETGSFDTPAMFDEKSVEMFRLMASKVSLFKKTHFWPMAMLTHRLFPPPPKVQSELGEPRIALRGSVNIAFRPELDFDAITAPGCIAENYPPNCTDDREAARIIATQAAFDECNKAYQALLEDAKNRNSPYYP